MKLSLLLFVLGLKLKASSWLSPAFRKALRQGDFVLVIRTDRPGEARTFVIRDGAVKSHRGRDGAADTELVWCDADTAVRSMLSKNEMDVLSAIGKWQVRVLGDMSHALRFMDLAK
jgi:hypothetical protein